jgi:hypothetical protein
MLDQAKHAPHIQTFMVGREPLQVGPGQSKQRQGGTGPVLLEVHEGSCQLNQALVKRAGWMAPLRQPQLLEDFVGLEEALLVEALEVAQVL